jgi:hypothetical protein
LLAAMVPKARVIELSAIPPSLLIFPEKESESESMCSDLRHSAERSRARGSVCVCVCVICNALMMIIINRPDTFVSFAMQ